MPKEMFQEEYTFARTQLLDLIAARGGEWDRELRTLTVSTAQVYMKRVLSAVLNLPLVLAEDGFQGAHHPILGAFNYAMTLAAQRTSEADVIFELVGWNNALDPQQKEVAVRRAAALKLFRHCYRIGGSGAQTIWVVSQPLMYNKFTSDMLYEQRAGGFLLRHLLNATDEIYSADEREQLAESTREAGIWCQRATEDAMNACNGDQAASDRIERWFGRAANDASNSSLKAKLARGFARMRGRIEENRIMYADRPYRRNQGATVLAAVYKSERMRTIYIKRRFFDGGDGPNNLPLNVAAPLTIVHELSHRVMDTHDHKYDHHNLNIRDSFSAAHASCNADSWGYYAADVMGRLTPAQRANVLGA